MFQQSNTGQHQPPQYLNIAIGVAQRQENLAKAGHSSAVSPTSSSGSSVFDSVNAASGANSQSSHNANGSAHEMKPFGFNGAASDQFGTSAGVSGSLLPGAQCSICGDKATGKHYGALSCDGCKGFFRRSVRKSQQYRCRFQRACQIDKDKRNQCRSCRLAKCFRSGMRKEAVQNERDKIGSKTQPASSSEPGAPPEIDRNAFSLQMLQQAENQSRRMYFELANGGINGPATNGGRQPAADEQEFIASAMRSQRFAGLSDIVDAMERQLLVLVEWSKAIPSFMTELSLDDQITMLRAHAGDHLLIGVTKRSIALRDTLLLANGAIIPRDPVAESEIYRIANRVIDELVRPMQELGIDDNECVCLKAIVFFDPSARGLGDSSRIRAWRHQVMLTLNDYVRERFYDPSLPVSTPAGRFGELMMLIPVLQNLSMLMVEQLQLAKVIGAAKVDNLLQEMLFGGGAGANDRSSGSETPCITPPPPSISMQRTAATNNVLQVSLPPLASMPTTGASHARHHGVTDNQTPRGGHISPSAAKASAPSHITGTVGRSKASR